MSVVEVLAALRRSHALLAEAIAETSRAEQAISEGKAAFEVATNGSSQREVDSANRCAHAATEEVRAARTAFVAAQGFIDAYCREVAGHGISTGPQIIGPDDADNSGPDRDRLTAQPSTPAKRYAKEIAELQRGGAKISPDRVVRVARHRRGHLVWLEEGHPKKSGKAHILRPQRRDEFELARIHFGSILDTIFDCLQRGEQVGTVGDAEIYEVETIDGRKKNIAIVVGSNGYIVTSYPTDRKMEIV